ncbi:glycosyltransferase family 2 protein [Roseivirga echinicomitans]
MKVNSTAIILVNWNAFDLTVRCIESLEKAGFPSTNIFLVDNASKDGSGNRLREQFPEVIFIQNTENLGFTGGNNIAMVQALEKGFEFVMLLNNDTEVTEDFLNPMLLAIEENEKTAAVQPLILELNRKDLIWNAGGDTNRFLGLSETRFEAQALDKVKASFTVNTDWITGCCILVRSAVISEIGMLDDKFFAYHEDVDWSIRMRKAGYELRVVPESTIFHLSMASLKSDTKQKEGFLSPFMHYLHVRNHLYLIRKHLDYFNPVGAWGYQFYKLLGYTAYFVFRGRFSKLKAVLKGFKEGLTT